MISTSNSALTASGSILPGKRLTPAPAVGLVDARDLIGRYRSKADLYDYLSHHRKNSFLRITFPVGQYYLPPPSKFTKDFLKEVFAGRKHFVSRDQLRPIAVPKYDELSVGSLIKDAMSVAAFAKFFPDQKTKSNLPDRQYFFNVINTIDPYYLPALISHAQTLRIGSKGLEENKDVIEVNEFWQKELKASPYFSRSPGKTLMLLKHNSKKARSGFKRKKVTLKGSYLEVSEGHLADGAQAANLTGESDYGRANSRN